MMIILLGIFVLLKLWGVIDWSWWVITAPVWGTFLLGMLLAAASRALK